MVTACRNALRNVCYQGFLGVGARACTKARGKVRFSILYHPYVYGWGKNEMRTSLSTEEAQRLYTQLNPELAREMK